MDRLQADSSTEAPHERADDRPSKPSADFPLFPHRNGQWTKKIKGKFVFFGPWRDPPGALARYGLYIATGSRSPETRLSNGVSSGVALAPAQANLTLRDLVNHFLTAKHRRFEAAELSRHSFADYHATCSRIVSRLGGDAPISSITTATFGQLRAHFSKTRGPVSLCNEIGRVRCLFRYGYESGLLTSPVRFGPEFAKPSRRVLRVARHARGERMFEAAEIRTLLKNAGPQLRAMILLGINCGLGNTDVATLTPASFDLEKRILDFPRPKTAIKRRAVLWPETVAALRAVMKKRIDPKKPSDKTLVFLTRHGNPWVRVYAPKRPLASGRQAVAQDSIALEFGKLLKETKLSKKGRAYYALRHSFRTVADSVSDRPAVDLVMGHENSGDIAIRYVERIGDERLRKVAEHVRAWLYPSKARASKQAR